MLFAGNKIGAFFVSQDELLQKSDFIIVSCPLTKETAKMFNDEAFSKMKKTAVFVNVARGGIVDQPALVRALKNKTIFAAGLDVMTPEPLPKNDPLLSLPNCGKLAFTILLRIIFITRFFCSFIAALRKCYIQDKSFNGGISCAKYFKRIGRRSHVYTSFTLKTQPKCTFI